MGVYRHRILKILGKFYGEKKSKKKKSKKKFDKIN